MTEERWRMNPILIHIIEDLREEENDIGKAIDMATKIFDKIPKDKRQLGESPFTCPYCEKTFETEKYN